MRCAVSDGTPNSSCFLNPSVVRDSTRFFVGPSRMAESGLNFVL